MNSKKIEVLHIFFPQLYCLLIRGRIYNKRSFNATIGLRNTDCLQFCRKMVCDVPQGLVLRLMMLVYFFLPKVMEDLDPEETFLRDARNGNLSGIQRLLMSKIKGEANIDINCKGILCVSHISVLFPLFIVVFCIRPVFI